MFTKSPLLRPTFTPTQSKTNVEALSARINNILHLLDTPTRSRHPQEGGSRETDVVVISEIQRIQEVITDLIALFQDYRGSIDEQLERLSSEVTDLDSRIESAVTSRMQKMREEIMQEVNDNIMKSFHRLDDVGYFDEVTKKSLQKTKQQPPPHRCEVSLEDMDNLRDELAVVKDAEIQIIAKINAISAANTECHERSVEALKSIRDVILNNQLINR